MREEKIPFVKDDHEKQSEVRVAKRDTFIQNERSIFKTPYGLPMEHHLEVILT